MHKDMTYILPSPGPDGKIAWCKFDGPPANAGRIDCRGGGVTLSVKVTSPASQARILYARSAEGTGSGAATQPVVMPDTPSGEGDPNTIVCRAPQRIADGGQLGPQACGHNYEWKQLAINGKDLAPDGKTVIDRPTVANPKGDGNPDAVICRTPKVVSSPQDWVKRFGPEVCQTNRFWADLIKNHQMVDAHGMVVTRRLPAGYVPNDFGGGYGTGFNPGGGAVGPGGFDSGRSSQSAEPTGNPR
jgi:hypothetical protein